MEKAVVNLKLEKTNYLKAIEESVAETEKLRKELEVKEVLLGDFEVLNRKLQD